MSTIKLAIQHGQTLDVARARLELTVAEVLAKYGFMVERVEWAANREAVEIFGRGFNVQMHVDSQDVHVVCDLPILNRVLAGPFVAGLKGIFQKTFQKLLTKEQ